MKTKLLALLMVCFIFSSCARSPVMEKSIWELRKEHPNYFEYYPITVFPTESGYLVAVTDDGTYVTKTATFLSDRSPSEITKMTLFRESDLDLLCGMSLSQIESKFGKFHADMGSGFYIPAYITENGYLLSFHESNSEYLEVRKCDLFSKSKTAWADATVITSWSVDNTK